MAGIDDVLERLLKDAAFAQQLARDPVAALAGYELSDDDLSLLSTQVNLDRGSFSQVEERISKAGMFGLLSGLAGGLGGGGLGSGLDTHGLGGPDTTPAGGGSPTVFPTESIHPADTSDTQGIIINYHDGPENPGVVHGFDPQPDPPGVGKPGEESGIVINFRGGGVENPGAVRGFDPQPDPPGVVKPGEAAGIIINDRGPQDPGVARGFNPQPDPPGVVKPGEEAGIIIND